MMKNPFNLNELFPVLLLCGLWCCSAFGQGQPQPIRSITGKEVASERLSLAIDSIVDAIELPGLSIAIINANEVVYQKAFGYTNLETQMVVDDRTIFEAASLSKPIFAYFVLKMAEEGVLDLDKPLAEYLEHPDIAENSEEAYRSITARMVLSHQTGFPNHASGEAIELAFLPGTDFLYSGEAFQYLAMVLSALLEKELDNGFHTLFQTKVTEPLAMPHSTFAWNDYLAQHKAYGHNAQGTPTDSFPGNGNWDGKTFNAYSSLHSESGEYANFLLALLQRQGLEAASFDQMFTEHTHFRDDNPLKQQVGQTGWGLGMAQKQTPYGTMHLHTGNNHDFQSYMMILPEQDFGIVFFTNSGKAIPFIQSLNSIIGPIF